MAIKTSRDAICDHLVANASSLTGGFFGPQLANENTARPYGVIRIGNEDLAYKSGRTKRLQILIYTDLEDWNDIDSLCNEVKTALDNTRVSCGDIDSVNYYLTPKCTGVTADWYDEKREVVMKIVEFEIKLGR